MTAVTFLLLLLLTNQNVTAQEPVLPIAPPDAEAGLVIYAERCELCHGPLGAGDGAQALTAGLEPRNFTDPTFHLTAEPQRMFDIITNGNMVNGMPPFGPASTNPLDEADRWNMIAAVYSFGTSPDTLALGETLFTDLGGDPAALPEMAYWFTRSNQTAVLDLESGDWGVDVSGLTDEEKQAIVDYGRAQSSYIYSDPLAAFAPIEAATISGLVVNGSTTTEVGGGEAVLRAFTTDLEQALIMTTTVAADGSYSFELENVLPDWVYLVSTEYNGLTFNSNANQLLREQPQLNMPIIIYDSTDDPNVVSIGQIHMILNFTEDTVQVSELYVFNNSANAVFVGESGDFADGTVEMVLPAGAENVTFRRAFGSLDNFAAAPEVIQTETGWADTIPLRPGDGSANLLVSFELPYKDGLRLAHPLVYTATNATAVLPDAGVELSGEGWVAQGEQPLSSGTFLAYMNSSLAEADALSMELDGRPRQISDTQGNAVAVRDSNQEIIIGVVALGLSLMVAAVMVRKWQSGGDTAVADTSYLLQAIANLDDAHEDGRINEGDYQQQRAQLKTQLLTIWPQNI
jgi:mono/diheme cytochrome c family protein